MRQLATFLVLCLALAAQETITYASGITITGDFSVTDQAHRLKVAQGSILSWEGGYGIMVPNPGKVPKLEIDWHQTIEQLESGVPMQTGVRVLIITAAAVAWPSMIGDAVLCECVDAPVFPPLDPRWPSVIAGMTAQDTADFLDATDLWIELRHDWPGRLSHSQSTMPSVGEQGYGGAMANVTSLGGLLLCSTRPAAEKQQVQDRLLRIADDFEWWGVTFPANGGHGNGRYFPWLVRKAVRGTSSVMSAADFSEDWQVYRDANNQIAFRAGASGPYETCCTSNRWAGAACAAQLCPWLQADADWITWSMGYLAAHVNDGWLQVHDTRQKAVINANRGVIGW